MLFIGCLFIYDYLLTPKTILLYTKSYNVYIALA